MHVLGIVLAGSHEVRNQLEAWYNNSLARPICVGVYSKVF